jgi:hypothetical protein
MAYTRASLQRCGNDARASQQVKISARRRRMLIFTLGRLILQSSSGGPGPGSRLPGKPIPKFQDRVNTGTTVLIIRVVFTV